MKSIYSILLKALLLALMFGVQPLHAQVTNRPPPIHNVDGSFIREWLVLGPFSGGDMGVDFLKDAGGEANVRPSEGDKVKTKDGNELVWTRLLSKRDMVNLDQVFDLQEGGKSLMLIAN